VSFWGTHAGAELDILAFYKGLKFGFEVKLSQAPRLSKSMHIVLKDLNLTQLFVVYPGRKSYDLAESVRVVSIDDLPGLLQAEEIAAYV